MKDSGPPLPLDRGIGRVLKGRRLLASVVLAWSSTVFAMALMAFIFLSFVGAGILAVSPILWLFPLWLLPKAPNAAGKAAPLLLLAVPVILVTSTFGMTQALSEMEVFDRGLRISAGGGALAALFEILGLYCWTRHRPAQLWSIVLLLALFGPAVACMIYLFFSLGLAQTA